MKPPFTICDLRFTIRRESAGFSACNHQSPIVNHKSARAFSLLELLVVIAILGILAALSVPVIRNLSKSGVTISGSRQMLDAVGRARQLAMSQRTTVYLVFLPPGFWDNPNYNLPGDISTWRSRLSFPQWVLITNLCDKQYSGYTFVARGAVGDQPGQHRWHYLDRWESLPEGTFIATNKFGLPGPYGAPVTLLSDAGTKVLYATWNQDYPHSDLNRVYTFFTNQVRIPFPTATNNLELCLYFPCIAFNYLGQLTYDGVNLADRDEYIPLANGSILYARDQNKSLVLDRPDVQEIPPGNSTNISYNIVHIDRLTGRAVLEYHKVQ